MTAAAVRRLFQIAWLTVMLLVVFGSPQVAQAQPELNFKRIVNNWPTIELYFTVDCNGQPAYFTDKRYFKVVENGIEIGDFELWCNEIDIRCSVSVALVLDAGDTMAGSGNTAAKAAGNAFVDMMDGVMDEAAVLWFGQAVATQQDMTTRLDLLHSAINTLPASGGSAVWDGIYGGIQEIVDHSVNQCRGVIIMTAGQDSGSSRQPADIIVLAQQEQIRIFTIGVGGTINDSLLQSIATLTGGRYYSTPSASHLAAIYQEIDTDFSRFQECLITYTATCRDGSLRTVDLTLSNFCGGSDTKTRTYIAPLETGTFDPAAQPDMLDLFPDPSSGELTLRIPSRPGDAIRVTVADLLGRVLLDRRETSASDLHQCAVSIAPAPPGTYVVSVISGARQWARTVRSY